MGPIMGAVGYNLFDTAIGRCGIAWSERGIVGIQLPEANESATRARLRQKHPGAEAGEPPPQVLPALTAIAALTEGEPAGLDGIALDVSSVSDFHRRVYEVARAIPAGSTLSYGQIAAALGMPGAARAVGQALGRNPFAIVVPCHRVVAANGRLGGFSANGGIVAKLKLLAAESAPVSHFDGDGTLGFDPDAAVSHLRAADPVLARVIDQAGAFRMKLKRAPSLFVALAEAIVYQQLSGRAAATIYARICALFPRPHEGPTPEKILRTPSVRLKAAGLSQAKLLSLKDLAARAAAGEVPTLAQAHAMGNEALIESLTQVRGIGRWTVEMLLMFRLGRPDVLPVDDYGIRKGFAVAYRKRKLPAPRDLEKYGRRWAPYRSVASWYLWRAADAPPLPGARTR
jgi:methylated-DNA-[protein]-cysteine S-methyltransferase